MNDNTSDPFLTGLNQSSKSRDFEAVERQLHDAFTSAETPLDMSDELVVSETSQDSVPRNASFHLSEESIHALKSEGAIFDQDDQPFTSFVAAEHVAKVVAQQTDSPCLVRAISDGVYVLSPAPRTKHWNETNSAPRALNEPQTALEELTLEDFDDDHAIHKIGLAKFKKLTRKGYKFKQSYRSMLHLFILMGLGSGLYLLPVPALLLLGEETVRKVLEQITQEQLISSVQMVGGLIAVGCMVKIWYERNFHRFTFEANNIAHTQGIIARKVTKTQYDNIMTHDVDQGFIQRLMNFGTLNYSTAGADGAELHMHNVYAPLMVEFILEHHQKESERR